MRAQNRFGLPQHIDRVSLIQADPGVADTRLYAVVTANPNQGSFDAEVVDTKGNRYLQLIGYRTVAAPNLASAQRVNAPQPGTVLQPVAA